LLFSLALSIFFSSLLFHFLQFHMSLVLSFLSTTKTFSLSLSPSLPPTNFFHLR
jgi:hypothetical protein